MTAEQLQLCANVREDHEESRGSEGARAIVDMATVKGTRLSCYLASNLMKLLGLFTINEIAFSNNQAK